MTVRLHDCGTAGLQDCGSAGVRDRGRMFVIHNDTGYEGMIIGIHWGDSALVVDPIKASR